MVSARPHMSVACRQLPEQPDDAVRTSGSNGEKKAYLTDAADSPCDQGGSRDPRYTWHYLSISWRCLGWRRHGLPGLEDHHSPFRRVPLLLDLGEDTFGLVVDAVCACWQLAVALDLLLPAHVASLREKSQPCVRAQ